MLYALLRYVLFRKSCNLHTFAQRWEKGKNREVICLIGTATLESLAAFTCLGRCWERQQGKVIDVVLRGTYGEVRKFSSLHVPSQALIMTRKVSAKLECTVR